MVGAVEPVLICNVGWMREYRGATKHDRPRGGGSYNERRPGSEALNFAKHDGRYYGFVRPGRGSHINVSRLGGNDERADGVLVVFCAPRPNSKTTLVVGWYENAAVLREPQKRGWGPGLYNIVSRKATLLAEPKRSFEVPRAQRDGYGLGQANVYYPDAGRDRRWLSHLLGHVASPDAKPGRSPRKRASKGRPQQSDPEIRTRVEQAAIAAAWQRYEDLGYSISSVEKDNLGWDLECSLGDIRKLVEVKGLQGALSGVELTPNEWASMKARADEYELCIVSAALTNKPRIHVGRLDRNGRRFEIELEDGIRLPISEVTAARIKP